MAVPAFLFVSFFSPFLPLSLGFAAGAMLWMSFSELMQEAYEHVSKKTLATIMTIAIMLMTLFQFFLD
jgi:zinc transporter ZupT